MYVYGANAIDDGELLPTIIKTAMIEINSVYSNKRPQDHPRDATLRPSDSDLIEHCLTSNLNFRSVGRLRPPSFHMPYGTLTQGEPQSHQGSARLPRPRNDGIRTDGQSLCALVRWNKLEAGAVTTNWSKTRSEKMNSMRN